ncbi:MAG: hypothetical protein DSY91_00575, partial [Deltaproteobacteria bacterium]
MNRFGRLFSVEIFGESHGPAVGAVIDGCPAGLPLAADDFTEAMSRRRSGAAGTTPRREPDTVEIVSGLFQGHTTGAPLTLLIRNTNVRSRDYDNLIDVPRPGHADFVAREKYKGRERFELRPVAKRSTEAKPNGDRSSIDNEAPPVIESHRADLDVENDMLQRPSFDQRLSRRPILRSV